MQRKIKVRVKINPYIKKVRTKHGKKQRVIHAHRRIVIRNFDSPSGKEELAKEFYVKRFGRSPEQDTKKFEHWKKKNYGMAYFESPEEMKKIATRMKRGTDAIRDRLLQDPDIQKDPNLAYKKVEETGGKAYAKEVGYAQALIDIGLLKGGELQPHFGKPRKRSFGSSSSPGGIRDIARFKEINNMMRKRKELILMGSDTLSPQTARIIARDQLVQEGKIKKSELKNLSSSPEPWVPKTKPYLIKQPLGNHKIGDIINMPWNIDTISLKRRGIIEEIKEQNRSSSPTTGDFKPSDVALVEHLQKNKQIGQKKKLKEKFSIDLDILEDHSAK